MTDGIKYREERNLKTRIEEYLKKARPLFNELNTNVPEKIDLPQMSKEFYEMATAYYRDAVHFYEKGEYVNALAALEYAEGWMDAGKRIGILK